MSAATKNLSIHDDWISEDIRPTLIEAASWVPMYFLNRSSRFDTHPLDIHWYYPIAVTEESLFGRVEEKLDALEAPLDIVKQTWLNISRHFDRKLGLYECTLSSNTFGTEGNPHFDFRNRSIAAAHLTILVYCCEKWDVTWAGETLVFDENHEITGGVMPKPGRVAVLHGDPYHIGRSVSRICPSDRRVLVFKAWDEDMLAPLIKAAGINPPTNASNGN